MVNSRYHRADNRTSAYGKRRVVGIRRLRHNDFIAGVKACHKGKVHSLATAGSNNDILRSNVNLKALVVLSQFQTQRLDTVRRAVLKHLAVNVLNSVNSHLRSG